MKYRLALFDVDSTLIEQEVIDLLAKRTPYADRVSDITRRAMAGELDFDSALQERVSLLRDLPESVFDEVLNEISFSPGALELISFLKEQGAVVGAVSGGFLNVLESLFENLPLDYLKANSLEVADGVLTGKTLGPIINRRAKAEALTQFAEFSKVPISETIAIGDGSNDIDMVSLAGLGVSYRGKDILNSAADIVITDKRLDALITFL
jgi:phosphoserine phosphatase